MSSLLIAHIGSYPRIGDEKDQQRYRRGMTNFQNKEISAHAFRDVEQSVTQELISEQLSAGLDEITDGLVSWQDPISHFAKRFSNMRVGGLRRYFDTNFYYRRPVITGIPKKKELFVTNEFTFAKQHSAKPVRAILTGPLTLASHTDSDLKQFGRLEKRVDLFSEALADEMKQLESAGCESIQIDEPILGQNPDLFPQLEKCIQRFRSKIRTARLILAVYFYPITPLYDQLVQLPLDLLQLDFTADGRRLWEYMIKKPLQVSIGFGLINSRSTRIEAIDPILNVLRVWIESRRPPLCYLTPCCGLEFLPRPIAAAKLSLLNKIRMELA